MMKRTIGKRVTVEVSDEGWPHWTHLTHGCETWCVLSHEEARDLHYALTRVVAFLDEKEADYNALRRKL